MKNGSLWLLALVGIFLMLAFNVPVHDNSTVPTNTQPISVTGQFVEASFQGIPGTTPPSAYSIQEDGEVYYLYFPDMSMKTGITSGDLVEVNGVLKYTKSETPDGTVHKWPVIEVKSITGLP